MFKYSTESVSIHAPVKGATSRLELWGICPFQSTRPVRARPRLSPPWFAFCFNPRARMGATRRWASPVRRVSIHAPVMGRDADARLGACACFNPRARVGRARKAGVTQLCFNPRARVGRDVLPCARFDRDAFQSTRPVRRATRPPFPGLRDGFNPRAPVSARPRHPHSPVCTFQSTRARGRATLLALLPDRTCSFNPRAPVSAHDIWNRHVPASSVSIHARP